MVEPRSGLDPRYSRYHDTRDQPCLAKTFVLVLDILGTQGTAGLKDATRNLAVFHRALHRAEQWTESVDQSTTVARWFSDSLVMADPCTDDGQEDLAFGFAVIVAAWVQLELATIGLFARGGMDLGLFFANEQVVYGPALIEAHRLENTEAVVPRVIISRELVGYALEQLREFGDGQTEIHRHLLAVDRDGWTFINYLDLVRELEPGEMLRLLGSHKSHIETNLRNYQRGNTAVHQKYQWLADYHDRFCRRMLAQCDELADMVIGPESNDQLELFGAAVPRPKDTAPPAS